MNPAVTGAVTALPYVLWAAVCAFGIAGCAFLLLRGAARRARSALARRRWRRHAGVPARGDRL